MKKSSKKSSKKPKKSLKKDHVRRLVMLVNTQKRNITNTNTLVKSKSNITNITNITNSTNTTNITSTLGIPEKKVDKLYYYLYDNEEATAEKLVEISDMTKDSFWNLKSNDNNIKKLRTDNKIAYYGISKELREDLDLRVKQKLDSLERLERELTIKKEKISDQNELLSKIQSIILDKSIFSLESGFAYLDMKELKESETEIFELIIDEPEETLEYFKIAIFDKGFGDNNLRFKNINSLSKKTIDDLRVVDLNKAICIECRSTTLTDVRPQITTAKFECPSCGSIISVLQIEKKFKEPTRCSCGRRGGFKDIARDMVDTCLVLLEDLKDLSDAPCLKVSKGLIQGKLTKQEELQKFNPGNDLRIFGILKPVEQQSHGAVLTRLDQAIEILEVEEFEPEIDLKDFSEKDIEDFEELSRQINEEGLRNLLKSYAPDVTGYENEKSALIIKGAQSRNLKDNKNRTKSNFLFVGDPGVAKTVLIKFYNRITQGSTYISGSGSSAVGLTSSTEKTEDGWVLKPGVLPLTKEDTIIDEFNLVNEEERPKLQEAMSESQITVNKASIHAKLRVSCGITANANPIHGVFHEGESLVKQFNLTPQILNRFDCIFVIKDRIDSTKDKKIAEIMIKREKGNIKPEYDELFLRKFFTYVRSRPEPKLNKTTEDYIPRLYEKVRHGEVSNTTNLLNPRFLEALIRLSKGYAKLRGCKEVSRKDVDQSYKILSATYLNLRQLELK